MFDGGIPATYAPATMDDFLLDLEETIDFHRELAEIAEHSPHRLIGALQQAKSMTPSEEDMDGKQVPDVALTALLLNQKDELLLQNFATTLHDMVETVLDYVLASSERIARYFPDHQRIAPFLRKTVGSDHWQIVSRYDVILTPLGEIKLLELNTGCPGGFMIAKDRVSPTKTAFELLEPGTTSSWTSVNMQPSVIVDTVLDLEKKAGMEPGLIAVMNDENQIRFELDQMVSEFRQRGRDALVIDARELTYENQTLSFRGQRISASYNKFRVSTPDSQNHCWKRGFEERYEAFLQAQQEGVFVSVNNLCGMSIAEDKGMLALFFEPEIRELFSHTELSLVDQCIPWTGRLENREATIDGRTENLLPFLRANKDRFVLKPANEGRGFGVLIGKLLSQEEWELAIEPNPEVPYVIQEFVESVSLPIGNEKDGSFDMHSTYLTLALAIAQGKPMGLISRVSQNAVTNVAQQGFIQAIFTTSS